MSPTFLAETWSVSGSGGSGKWYSRVTDSYLGKVLCILGWVRVGFPEGGQRVIRGTTAQVRRGHFSLLGGASYRGPLGKELNSGAPPWTW